MSTRTAWLLAGISLTLLTSVSACTATDTAAPLSSSSAPTTGNDLADTQQAAINDLLNGNYQLTISVTRTFHTTNDDGTVDVTNQQSTYTVNKHGTNIAYESRTPGQQNILLSDGTTTCIRTGKDHIAVTETPWTCEPTTADPEAAVLANLEPLTPAAIYRDHSDTPPTATSEGPVTTITAGEPTSPETIIYTNIPGEVNITLEATDLEASATLTVANNWQPPDMPMNGTTD